MVVKEEVSSIEEDIASEVVAELVAAWLDEETASCGEEQDARRASEESNKNPFWRFMVISKRLHG